MSDGSNSLIVCVLAVGMLLRIQRENAGHSDDTLVGKRASRGATWRHA